MFDREELNNPHYNDCYFSYDEGVEEALYVFVDGNGFPEAFGQREKVIIAETGYGTGLNLMALLSVVPPEYTGEIVFYSVEKYPLIRERIVELIGRSYSRVKEAADEVLTAWERVDITVVGWHSVQFSYGAVQVTLNVFIGDVSDYMASMPEAVDHWFLDGHSPDKNPDMWDAQIMKYVGVHSHSGTTVASFTAAGLVKRALREAGFVIKRRKGFGGKRHMIQGVFQEESV